MLGDLTEEETEAIVNPTNSKFESSDTMKKILEKGGQQILDACNKLGTLEDVAMTAAGGQLKCKHVVHMLSPQSIIECQTIIKTLLSFVSQKGLHSLSIPLIRASNSNLTGDQVASCTANAILQGASKKSLGELKHIRLVGCSAAEWNFFETAIQQAFSGDSAPWTNASSVVSGYGFSTSKPSSTPPPPPSLPLLLPSKKTIASKYSTC